MSVLYQILGDTILKILTIGENERLLSFELGLCGAL